MWFVDALPKGPTGKILKREIVAPASTSDATRRHPVTTDPDHSDELADQAAPLDALLVEAALRPAAPVRARRVHREVRRRWPASRDAGRRLGDLAAELGRIAAGTSTIAPSSRDRRFTDPAWTENPLLRRLVQAYLAAGQTAEQLVADADLDWRDEQRVRFLVENLVEALAPSNVPLVNPASAKAAIDTAGMSLVRGGTEPGRDLAIAPRGSRRWWTDPVSRSAEHRGHPRRRGAAHRGLRADPVRAADRAGPRGPAADRAADDQQVLRARPGAGPQPGRVPASGRVSRSS